MFINFMKYDDENKLRQALENHLKISLTTVEDALLFCKVNKPNFWGPLEIDQEWLQKRNHEAGIIFGTRASIGVFQLTNWKTLLRSFYRLWWLVFVSAEWRVFLYFDKGVLSEIEILRFEHWL